MNLSGYFLGDAKGEPVGKSGFYLDCHMFWNTTGRRNGGPCHFKPTTTNCNHPSKDPDSQMRMPCFDLDANKKLIKKSGVAGCENAEYFERDGFKIQRGGPPAHSNCQPGWQFVMPYEMSLVIDFDVDDTTNLPTGCGPLDDSWTATSNSPNVPIYVGSTDGNKPSCESVQYAPEGLSLPDIVELFANDHDAWQKSFFDAWEKLQLNGYDLKDLKQAPANGQLMA